jgi:hypothetical protein
MNLKAFNDDLLRVLTALALLFVPAVIVWARRPVRTRRHELE